MHPRQDLVPKRDSTKHDRGEDVADALAGRCETDEVEKRVAEVVRESEGKVRGWGELLGDAEEDVVPNGSG